MDVKLRRFLVSLLMFMLFFACRGSVNRILTTSAIVTNTEKIRVYQNSACTKLLSSIDWGTMSPGSSNKLTIYVKNHGETSMVLNIKIENWIPAELQNHLSVTWNRDNYNLIEGESIPATLTLSLSRNITEIQYFSFNTIIEGNEPNSLIMDDSQAVFNGTWKDGIYSGYFGSGYKYSIAGTGTDKATWGFYIPKRGNWEVYTYWVTNGRRATNTPYTINAATSTTIRLNQQVNGSRWVSIGQYQFENGLASIFVSNNADGIVIADAIRLVYLGASDVNPEIKYSHLGKRVIL